MAFQFLALVVTRDVTKHFVVVRIHCAVGHSVEAVRAAH